MNDDRIYRARQDRARELARARDLDALLVWARGGGTQDHYADVYYLSGFYTQQPFVPDVPGRWRAQGHAALLLPVEGPVMLFHDMSELQPPEPCVDHHSVTSDPVAAVADLVRGTLPRSSVVGILGGEALAWRWGRVLEQELAAYELIEADEVGACLRLIKSQVELAKLRIAGWLGAQAMMAALDAAQVGASEASVATAAIGTITSGGGILYGMGLSSGPWAHVFGPSSPTPFTRRRLERGDLLRMDLYGSVDGYLFDLSRSIVVGNTPDPRQEMLLTAVREAVQAGIAAARPGETVGSIARSCEDVFAESEWVRQFGTSSSMLGGAWGHGLGLAFEAPWIFPDNTTVLEPGMCLAVERRIEVPRISGGVNYEDNVIITADGPEVITHTQH